MKRCFDKFCFSFLLLLLLNIGMVLFYYTQKDGFHVDEIWSFAHANSSQGAFLAPSIDSHMYKREVSKLYNHWFEGDFFHDYVTVQPEEQFRYGHVWENLAQGVHPPLYYVLLHTVCSFFPEYFSKWLGAGLNIAIWCLLLFMMFKLAKLVLEDEFLALLAVALYAFSEAGFDAVLYIRMYILQTLFAVCLMYETVKMLKENEADNKRLFLIFLYSSLGMLTQYSSLVFSFIVAGTGGSILCWRKNWRLLFRYAVAMALSPMVLFAVFPATWDVLLNSQRAEEVIKKMNLTSAAEVELSVNRSQGGIGEILWRIDRGLDYLFVYGMGKVYLQQLLSLPRLSIFFVVIIPLLGVAGFYHRKTKYNVIIWYLLFVCLLTGLFLDKYMPLMYDFLVRYYMLLLPMAAILTIYFLIWFTNPFGLSRRGVYALLGVLVLVNSLRADFSNKSSFTFDYDLNTEQFLEEVKEKDVIVFTETSFMYFEFVSTLQSSPKVFFADKSCNDSIALEEVKRHKGAYVLFFNTDARRCVMCAPREKAELCPALEENLRYKFLVRVGERYYDLYEVVDED